MKEIPSNIDGSFRKTLNENFDEVDQRFQVFNSLLVNVNGYTFPSLVERMKSIETAIQRTGYKLEGATIDGTKQ